MALAEKGLVEAIRADPALAKGVNVHEGRVTNRPVAETHRLEFTPLSDLVPLRS
jgi:alanine dehydrogenase